MTILFLGARGTLGRPLVAALRSAGHAVVESDLNPHVSRFAYRPADLANFREVEEMFEHYQIGESDLVFHLAAEPGRVYGTHRWERLWSTNCVGLRNVLALQERRMFRLVWFSSSEVYGERTGVATEEGLWEEPIRPKNDYGITKLCGELMIRNSPASGRTLIVRPFMIYGPPEEPTPYRSAVSRWLWAALHDEPLAVYAGRRAWLYIDDFVATVARIPERWDRLPGPGSVNIASLDSPEPNDVVASLCCAVAGASNRLVVEIKSNDRAVLVKEANCLRAQDWLAHAPKVPLHEGLARTVAWLRERDASGRPW